MVVSAKLNNNTVNEKSLDCNFVEQIRLKTTLGSSYDDLSVNKIKFTLLNVFFN